MVNLVVSSPLFDTKDVGINKDVVGALSLSGADAGNYTVNSSHTAKADITPKPVTGSFTADDKVYDGNTSAVVLTRSISGEVSGETVTLVGGTATFANKNVGARQDGDAERGDSRRRRRGQLHARLGRHDAPPTSRRSRVTGSFTADDKVYDGNTVGDGPDPLDLAARSAVRRSPWSAAPRTFANKNVGDGKTVTLTGCDARRRRRGQLHARVGRHDDRRHHAEGAHRQLHRRRQGLRRQRPSATVLDPLARATISGDDGHPVGGTATFGEQERRHRQDGHVAATLSGADAGNYTLTTVATTTADITPKPITGSFTAADKVYDGNTVGDRPRPARSRVRSAATTST